MRNFRVVFYSTDLPVFVDARVGQGRALMRTRPQPGFPVHRGQRPALRLLAVVLLAACAACTVGPDFKPQHPETPENFADTQRKPQAQVASITDPSDPDPRWWRTFNDAELNALIDRAVAENLTLQQAVLRVVLSRAQERQAGAAALPHVNATGSYTYEQLGVKGQLESHGVPKKIDSLGDPGSPLDSVSPTAGATTRDAADQILNKLENPVSLYQIGFDASWELDLFGRVRRTVEATQAQTQAALESRNDALVQLEAEVAQTYARLRGAQLLVRITQDEIRQNQDVLDLTRSRQRAGLASETDVERADAQLGAIQSQLPVYEQQMTQALNGLSFLVGKPPGTLDAELSQPGALPPVPPAVPIGLPAALARRRPDIRQAEANLHAATAQVGVAIAQLFPDLSLTGQFGFRATQASYLTRWASHFYSIGPQVTLPIFEGGALRAQIAIAKTEQANAVLDYRQAVLSALRDVDDALVRYRTDQSRLATLQRVVDANQRAFDLARNGYLHGLNSFIDVLDTERQLTDSRLQFTQQTVTVTTDLIAVYKTLGGGWQGVPLQMPAAGPDEAGGTAGALDKAGSAAGASDRAGNAGGSPPS
jgi:multidrug efflux system outer membrane protein